MRIHMSRELLPSTPMS